MRGFSVWFACHAPATAVVYLANDPSGAAVAWRESLIQQYGWHELSDCIVRDHKTDARHRFSVWYAAGQWRATPSPEEN